MPQCLGPAQPGQETQNRETDMLIEPIIQEHQADQLAALSEQE